LFALTLPLQEHDNLLLVSLKKGEDMLRIGDFSKLSKVTIKALRYYDEVGLLKPHYVNYANGYRYYLPDQLNTICTIVAYKNLGFSLEEIKYLIFEGLTHEKILALLLGKQKQIQGNMSSENEKLIRINAFINKIKETRIMAEIALKKLPEVIVASKRIIISKYSDLHQEAPAMGEKMKEHAAVCLEPEYCFNIYHDGEYKESDIDVEICEAVVDYCENKDGIIYKKMDSIDSAACIFHKGPYENLGESYAKVFKWIEENNYKISDHCRESFIDGCWNKENAQDWLTEVQIPVTKK
jgi:DNA-binding transcriptional MerR regulator